MKKRWDLVVVGAGPAGLTAAKFAAEAGLSVVLIERKDNISEILRMCGMMIVTLSSKYMGERVVYNEESGKLCFPMNGFSLKYDGPTKDFYSWQIYSPNEEKVLFGDYDVNSAKGRDGRATAVYSKSHFLQGLLEECQNLGVKIFSGENVVCGVKNNEGVVLRTASGKIFESVFVIAADGRQSRIARSMGMNRGRGFYCTITSVGYEMTGLDLPEPLALHQPLMKSGNPPMMGFVVPRAWNHEGEDVWLAMISNVDMQGDHEGMLNEFVNQSRFSPWFKNARIVRRCGCSGNMYAPLVYPFKDNVLFAGDAGWCQEAEMTGAVMSGWKAGTSVVYAMTEKQYSQDGVQDYLDWWRINHIEPLDYQVFLRNLYMPILCTDSEIDYLFGTIKEVLPTVLDPYEVPENLGKALAKIMPQVQQDRPELISKLTAFAKLPPDEVLKETIRGGFNCSFSI